MRKRAIWLAGVLAAAATGLVLGAGTASAQDATAYEVTITNLLDAGQPLTPPAVATHSRRYEAFRVGQPASAGVQQIAENGNTAPLLAEYVSSRFVSDSLMAPGGPLVPAGFPGSAMFDDTTSFEITASHGANFISFVS